jgi:selenocysteine-specific elongation factor
LIIATAGHVDHGKTALVRALTGVNTDRLPEEKTRGLSIDLGYAYGNFKASPDSCKNVRVGFVDVPGHHRFVTNMVAGVTGIDTALLVVAADDGVMPQTKEHLAILDLLGVTRGTVAITKADKVDDARLTEVEEQVSQLMNGTSLAHSPIIATSVFRGASIERLRGLLPTARPNTIESQMDQQAFRLAVDRSFVLEGVGVILTGLVLSGRVRLGEQLVIMPAGLPVSVRCLRTQGTEADTAAAGQRCAVLIGGRHASREAARRGDWLCRPNTGLVSRRVDVRVRPARSIDNALCHDLPVHVHIGARDVTGRLALLDRRRLLAGEEAWGQLVFDRDIYSVRGDRFILRDQSAQITIAGGWIVDPRGAHRGRARPERLNALAAMAEPTPDGALRGLLRARCGPVNLPDLARRWNLIPDAAEAIWARAEAHRVGPLAIELPQWQEWRAAVLAALEVGHQQHPEQLGLALHAIATSSRLRAPEAQLVLDALAVEEAIIRSFGLHRIPEHQPCLAPVDQALWDLLQPALGEARRPAQVLHQIAKRLEWKPDDLLALLVRAAGVGLVIRISKNRFLLPETVLHLARAAEDTAADDPGNRGHISIARFREQAKTGRNLTVDVLEFLDRRRLTRRNGSVRQLVASVDEIFNITTPRALAPSP